MPNDTSDVRPPRGLERLGHRYYLNIIPPERTEPIRKEDFDTVAGAEKCQQEPEKVGCASRPSTSSTRRLHRLR
jgi:hypothetical protein